MKPRAKYVENQLKKTAINLSKTCSDWAVLCDIISPTSESTPPASVLINSLLKRLSSVTDEEEEQHCEWRWAEKIKSFLIFLRQEVVQRTGSGAVSRKWPSDTLHAVFTLFLQTHTATHTVRHTQTRFSRSVSEVQRFNRGHDLRAMTHPAHSPPPPRL